MKRLAHLHIIALTLAFMVFAGTSAFAADPSNALNGDNQLLSTSDFSALSGVSADPMNEAELDNIQGKGCGKYVTIGGRTFYIPCIYPVWPKWPKWPPGCLPCLKFGLKRRIACYLTK